MTAETETRPAGSAIWRFLASCKDMTARDRRNSWRAGGWLFLWSVAFVGTTWGGRRELLPEGLAVYVAIAATTVLGVVAVLSYARFIREADELQRKVQLDALSLGFGGGFLAAFTFELLEQTGLIGQVDSGDLFLVMVLIYVLGIVVGARRYA
jgi:hypothetical protein